MDIDPVPRLVALLRTHAARLNARVLQEMYENPFWEERYGARGRRFAQEDGDSHVAHLVLALESRNPALLVSYGQWLQRVLTTRGMCSRHLDENFHRLATAIRDERWEGAELAVDLLEQARVGLQHPSEPARSVERSASQLARAVMATGGGGRLPRGVEDVLDLVSYAADALANERPDLFAAHLAWFAGFLERRGVRGETLQDVLQALRRSGAEVLPLPAAKALAALLSSGDALAPTA